MNFTKDQFILCYNSLGNEEQKEEANNYTIMLGESSEAWRISRELLCDTHSTYKFLGAQMLHLKTRNSFNQLTPEQQAELTSYVFTLLFELCGSNNKPVIAKLAGTCAIIIVYCARNASNLETFLMKLGEAMGLSMNHLRVGLEVIGEIPDQCKLMKNKTYAEKKIIKNTILEKSQFFINMFLSIFKTEDPHNVTKNLEAIVYWADFGLPIMEQPQLVAEILLNATKTIENLDFTTEIFGFLFKYHFFKDAESVDSITLTKQELTQNYLQNLILIVKFIIESSKYIFQQMNTEHLYNYGFLVKQLILYHPWIISQSIETVGQPLLQFMHIVLEQKSLKVSSISLDFWREFYQKVKNNTDLRPFILNNYNTTYSKLMEKTLRNFLPKNLIKENEEVVCEDETDDGEADDEKVTFEKYRQDSSFLYEEILAAFKSQHNGVSLFFEKVFHLLESQNDCKIELGLFIIYSSIGVLKDQTWDVIPMILDYCSNCIDINPNIKKHVTKIFSQLSDEIRVYNKFEPVLITILNYLTDVEISEIASKTFDDLMVSMPQHANITLVQRMINDCKNNLRQLNNIPLFTKILSGVLTLIQKLQDQQYSVTFLKQLLQQSINYFKSTIEQNSIEKIELSLNEAQLYLVHFQKLAKQKHPSSSLAVLYYITILNSLLNVFQMLQNSNIKYNPLNSLGLATSIYCKIIKNIGVSHLRDFDIVNISISISNTNPKENYQLLKILIVTIQQSIGLSLPLLDNWISTNLFSFVNHTLELIPTTLDPDIIRNFYTVLDRTMKYNPSVMVYLPNNNQVIQIGLKILTQIDQMIMSKSILEFLLSALSIPQLNLEPLYQLLLTSLLQSLQYLGTNGIIIVSQIFIRILGNQSLGSIQSILVRIINHTSIKQIKRLDLVIEAVGFFINTKDETNLKSAFIYLGLVLKGLGESDIMALEMKYKAAQKSRKLNQ